MRRSHASKRWHFPAGDIQAEARLQMDLGVHPILARLLVQRGLVTSEDAHAFLNPSLSHLHDPFLLPDALLACERLKIALQKKERILVHGDYDGDGVTSSALLTRVLRKLGADVDVFVPHRKRDGYDMRVPIIEQARQDGVTLIVTTDCGIQRIDEVEHARQYGIDVIITDHHTPSTSGKLPAAVAVVNPQRVDSKYPFRSLAGVGVAFKLCEALTRHLGHPVEAFRRHYMDLAAIGTVTDVMPLLDENRVLVKFGIEALKTTKKVGLSALIDSAGIDREGLTARSIGFSLGPRLNAASRIGETTDALDLLLTTDPHVAATLASKLEELNRSRRDQQDLILGEALAQVALQDVQEARCLVLSGKGWPGSIVGIVAGKIKERFNRPCVMIALDEITGAGRGSARSINAFNIFNAIDSCSALLNEYGGHALAAGLSIDGVNVEEFANQMNLLAKDILTEEDLLPSLEAAMEIDPSAVDDSLLEQIEFMAPFGAGNLEPHFVSRNVPIVETKRIGPDGKHLRLTLRADGLNRNGCVSALWWHNGELAEALQGIDSVDLCYQPQFNRFRGERTVQFMIEDVRPLEW